MPNISIDTLYALLDRFDTLQNLLTEYGTFLIIAAAVFALLNCFFGYILRKIWSVLLGVAIGASGGMLLATYTEQSYNMTLGVTLGLGFIFGLLALLLYRIGTFFLIIGFLSFSLFKLLNPQDLIMLLFLIAIAVVVALIGVPFERITVILITHYMEEVIDADKIYVMDHGHVVMEGTPREIFSQVDTLKKYRLDVPQVTEVAYLLRKEGVDLPADILTIEEMVGAICQLKSTT